MQLHFPSALPSAWFSCPHLSRLAPLRYYGASDSYDRRTSHRSLRLLRLAFQASRPQPRHAPERRFISRLSAFGFLGFAMNEQARHATPPNQVRHPTGYSFASGYSPPRLATTQLPSATLLRFTMTRTCTVPTKRPHGRTHSSAGWNPVHRVPIKGRTGSQPALGRRAMWRSDHFISTEQNEALH